ncbi:MAG TPA: T9SS type A sorting domain-containing protein [Flavobacteriaceae bacterium]|nr:T9SS type A sorting domain-containing protein [Flavobacteriaceae bacterium]
MRKTLLLIVLLFITALSYSADITSTTTGNWDAEGTWVGGVVPGSGDNVTIASGHTVTQNDTNGVSINTITVTGTLFLDYSLTVATNSSIAGSMTCYAAYTQTAGTFSNTGTITVFKGIDIVFSSTDTAITNTGDINLNSDSNEFASLVFGGTSYTDSASDNDLTYNRYITTNAVGWDLMGSPVTGETFTSVVNDGNIATNGSGSSMEFGIGAYDNTDNTWGTYTSTEAASAGTMSPGDGYEMATTSGSTISFTGQLTTGTVSVAIENNDSDNSGSGTRFSLVSNPYASYICLNSNADTASSIATTDFLTHNTSTNDVIGASGNEAVYLWGGTSADYTTITNASAATYAAPGQGFFIAAESTSSANLEFTVTTRTINGSDDAISGDTMDPDDRAELFIGISQSDIDRHTEIYFLDNTTDGLNPSYDGAVFSLNDNTISVFSRLVEGDQGIDMSIQSLAYSEMWDKVIPIGINAMAGEEMIVSVTHKTTPADLKIYLEDTQEGTFTLINNEDFVLTPSSDLEGVGRFFIHTTEATLSDGEVNTSLLNAYKEVNANYITIEGLATQATSTEVSLYNILGTRVMDTTLDNTVNTQTISTNRFSTGIYIIKLESGKNQLTKKLIIK